MCVKLKHNNHRKYLKMINYESLRVYAREEKISQTSVYVNFLEMLLITKKYKIQKNKKCANFLNSKQISSVLSFVMT
jgi:hypothetical protein